MEHTKYLVIGGGVSGLAFADAVGGADVILCEAENELGGYCRTVRHAGFVWDYSGHFFHFRHPEIERFLVERMAGERVLRIERCSRIYWGDRFIDFPFQKNIHQLPQAEFIDCLVDLFFRDEAPATSFKDMLYKRLGKSISEKFLIPYNEKLYATDLATLDVDAMGRFFPHASLDEIIRHFRSPEHGGYNQTFTYPANGAAQYVAALARGIAPEAIRLGTRVVRLDPQRRVATTTAGEIGYEIAVSTSPLPRLLAMAGVEHDAATFSYNRVLVFNLGFDRKGWRDVHWVYFPQPELSFYRVGFYDNIFGTERMSLYVEIGLPTGPALNAAEIENYRRRVLADLTRCGLVRDHKLVAFHSVLMDPAYVHITRESLAATARAKAALAREGTYSIGRYGSWTYCSIEDNIVEARALAAKLKQAQLRV